MYAFKPSVLNTLRSMKYLQNVQPRRIVPDWDIAATDKNAHGIEKDREAQYRKTVDSGIPHLSINSLYKVTNLEDEVLPLLLSSAINYIAFSGKKEDQIQISIPYKTPENAVMDANLCIQMVDPKNPPSFTIDDPIFEVVQLAETMSCMLGKVLSNDQTILQAAQGDTLLVMTSKKEQEEVLSRALQKRLRRSRHREVMGKKYLEGMVKPLSNA